HTRFSRDWSSDVCSSDLPDTSPTSIAVGSDGTFYAVSYGPVIFRVAADGEVAWSRNLGSGLDAVTGVALAEDQEVLYISGHTSRSEERRGGKEFKSGVVR